ncbi:AI-2E family transporter [Herbiconiux sp. L3-i23]|uniref:AI-2E family transporter n=1 Tax=Herbiconiux sp. L3-i23 TaxID=2905871 RepID=UPI00206FC76A|nr:AI-2E family transporter [Herbiconiux sp. L3-i23]BDI21929.1 AI-2E family transporter [Herbiconiux sp. L3-i23]
MKILNPFRVGLLAGLGVLVAILIGSMIGQLATILTYVGAALFLSLGLDPLVSFLERRGLPRWAALLITLVVVIGAFVGILFAVVPAIVAQAGKLVQEIVDYTQSITWSDFLANIQSLVGDTIGVDISDVADQVVQYLQSNFDTITGGVISVATGVIGGVFGAIIVLILTLYFTASLDSFKRGLYQLIPATKREKFADITEQITQSVGRYVIGQAALALCNGVLSFIFLSIIGAQLPVVFAFIAFLASLIPLVGTISGSVLIVLGQILLLPDSPATWITAAVYYLIYMQVEAYLLSPNIMNRAVKVPGVVVVIAALVGGTLLGILGALIAIPVAAAIQLIIKQVVIPRQNEL